MDVPSWGELSNWTAVTFLGVSFLFLIHWLVRSMAQEFRSLRQESRIHQAMTLETFRLLVTHDAQSRNLDQNTTQAGQTAKIAYDRVLNQLDNLEKILVANSDGKK